MVTQLPPHLRSERALAEYFEAMDLSVESVSVCREVQSLKRLLDRRTDALLKLEAAWVNYLGNPSRAAPNDSMTGPLVDVENSAVEEQRGRLVVPNRKRPTLRPGWFARKVDALEYLEEKFKEADEAVKKRRLTGKFKATHAAFVTFEKMSSAVCSLAICAADAANQSITASRGSNRTFKVPGPGYYASGSRTPRYHLVKHGNPTKGYVCARTGSAGFNGCSAVLLAHTDIDAGWSVELQGDQEGLACTCAHHRRQPTDCCHRAEFAAFRGRHFSERVFAFHTGR